MNKFHLKNGDISAYGFACGLVKIFYSPPFEVTLQKIEGGAYRVLSWSPDDAHEINRQITNSLTEARKTFKRYRRDILQGR